MANVSVPQKVPGAASVSVPLQVLAAANVSLPQEVPGVANVSVPGVANVTVPPQVPAGASVSVPPCRPRSELTGGGATLEPGREARAAAEDQLLREAGRSQRDQEAAECLTPLCLAVGSKGICKHVRIIFPDKLAQTFAHKHIRTWKPSLPGMTSLLQAS